jgi:hypothetical protein
VSFRNGSIAVIVPEEPAKCELCGKTAELRPYGPKGERICFECGEKNPGITKRQLERVLFGRTVQ